MNIRPFHMNDATALCSWLTDEMEMIQWGGSRLNYPLCNRQLQHMQIQTSGEKPLRQMFIAEHNQQPIAHAQLTLDWDHGVAQLGHIAVKPALRGKHLTQPFLQKIIDRLFAAEDFSRIELSVFTSNHPAIQICRNLGFQLEGIRRSCLTAGNSRQDIALFGLLRSDLLKSARLVA